MTVRQLCEEFDLSLDDIRWYLCNRIAESILLDRDEPVRIVERLWSGKLEAELYNMEDQFLEQLQDELSRGLTDERAVRDHLDQARMLKMRRRR